MKSCENEKIGRGMKKEACRTFGGQKQQVVKIYISKAWYL